jgi:asparagine synthase (glutamine-hydrolysing)
MCGICGELAFSGAARLSETRTERMMDAIWHRGPDSGDTYVSSPVALGHRRLSIIDLKTGAQPLSNEDGTVWIVYNGEVYNYAELTTFLKAKGHTFRTTSDTEVIVHLYEELGEECVGKLQGMFAFALWDDRQKKLLLARDRVGIKPLYYARTADGLVFGSEIKALLAHGGVHADMDTDALDSFLTYLYIPGESTLFRDVYKLSPGHYLVARPDGQVRITQYWDLHFPPRRNNGSFEERVDALKQLLGRTVRDHMISDVPVGVLLSGGVDSTAVLSFAREAAGTQLSTFTIGFDTPEFPDERPYARLAAQHIGSRHFEMTISPRDFWQTLPKYVWHMEEPVCEPPAISLYFISRLAREHVTVLLSGEGGDEAFAGYPDYRNLLWLERLKQLLGPARFPASSVLRQLGHALGLARIQKYAPLLALPFGDYYYSRSATPATFFNQHRRDLWAQDFQPARAAMAGADIAKSYLAAMNGAAPLDKMLYVDTKTWLPDDLLVKADKMTMANSVELRVPFLDHHVLEFAAALPSDYKLKGWSTKRILKAALRERVPAAIINRPKAGFPVPYARWIRDELRQPIREILTDRTTIQRGYFRRDTIERLLDQNSPQADYSKEIFSLAVLELWHRIFKEQKQVALG